MDIHQAGVEFRELLNINFGEEGEDLDIFKFLGNELEAIKEKKDNVRFLVEVYGTIYPQPLIRDLLSALHQLRNYDCNISKISSQGIKSLGSSQ